MKVSPKLSIIVSANSPFFLPSQLKRARWNMDGRGKGGKGMSSPMGRGGGKGKVGIAHYSHAWLCRLSDSLVSLCLFHLYLLRATAARARAAARAARARVTARAREKAKAKVRTYPRNHHHSLRPTQRNTLHSTCLWTNSARN